MVQKVLLFLVVLFFVGRPVLAAGVEYNLAYPGMLPDSPFHVLKTTRDNLMEFLLRDPKQKAFYLLLLSDKRLAAGQALIAKKKTALGETTITKSQEYYTRSVDLALKVNDIDLISKLVVAGTKHEEVIAGLPASEILQAALKADQNDRDRVLKILVNQ